MVRLSRRRLGMVCLMLVVAGMVLLMRTMRPTAQRRDASPEVKHDLPVSRAASANATTDMGSTFYHLEGRAARVTSRYADGSAVATRSVDGSVRSALRDNSGNELTDVVIQRPSGLTPAKLEFPSAGGRIITQVRPNVRPTLDWTNAQAYVLWRDRPDTSADLEWQGRFVRSRGPKPENLDDQLLAIDAEFENGVAVSTARNSREIEIAPRVRRRPTFISRVVSHGTEVGVMRWYANERVLAWDFPGLSKGFVNEERLRDVGGWSFTPTMTWASVQGLAFYEFHSRMKTRGSVAAAAPNLFRRALDLLMPPLSANEEGCDSLHYLDGTVFRGCCDTHDRCYERIGGCAASSWYWVPMWGNAWQCSVCNTQATVCFLTGGLVNFDYKDYW